MKQYIHNDTNWAARGTPWVHLGTSWFPWEHHRTDHCCKLTIYNGLSELTGGRLSRKTPLNHLAEHYQLLSTNNSFGSCGGPPRAITTKTQGTLTRIDLQLCASFQPNLFSGFGRDECRTDKQIVNLISPITMVIIIKSYTWYKCILPTLRHSVSVGHAAVLETKLNCWTDLAEMMHMDGGLSWSVHLAFWWWSPQVSARRAETVVFLRSTVVFLPLQDHKSGTVCHPISDYVGCHTASSGGYWRHFYSDSEATAQCELF